MKKKPCAGCGRYRFRKHLERRFHRRTGEDLGPRCANGCIGWWPERCQHRLIVPYRFFQDGSIYGRCWGCGDDTFPIIDAAWDRWVHDGRP